MNKQKNKLPCYNSGVHCMNNACAEVDLGDGKGVNFYCRSCIENADLEYDDPDTYEYDESLVFCKREWDEQGE